MAPIVKEADAPSVSATTTAAPSAPAAKPPSETPARPQPVPLEIPVTVNGARTVEGSDKREPFSETTQTVLVFPHGAVLRTATPLAPGQLVFLTNEKTKKEVVCQVVKSKSGGSANGYVELQFTEPAPAFWGLRLPGTVATPPAPAPAVPRPAATTPPPAPKVVAPAPPAARVPAPSVAPPVAQVTPPVRPAAAPPAPPTAPVIKPASGAPPQSVVGQRPTLPAVVSLAPAPKLPDSAPANIPAPVQTTPSAPLVSVPPRPPFSADQAPAPVPSAPKPLIPPPTTGPCDYSKEIESLFAVPQAPVPAPPKLATPVAAPPSPTASSPSTEELKQQTARLQEQLSAMLFTETPAAASKPPAPPLPLKLDTPVTEVANKILEIAQQESKTTTDAAPKNEVVPEPKSVVPVRTASFSSLGAKDGEVEIPAWLRPLSQHSEAVAAAPGAEVPADTLSTATDTAPVEESQSEESSPRAEVAVFGGQLLSGDTSSESAVNSGSNKGLVIGLAAGIVLLAAGGGWYFRQNSPSVSTPAAQVSSAPASSAPVPSTVSPASPATPSRPAAVFSLPSTTANSAPARTSPPAPVAPVPAPVESRRETASHDSAPVEEPAKKPALGEVHLAAPVVRGSGEGQASGEPLPAVETPDANSGADALTGVARQKGPAVPVGGDVKTAQLIKAVPPVYPQMARSQRVTGNVTLDALIDADGNVAQVKVISGPPVLHQAALEAVKQWKYTPAQLNGNATASHLTVTVQFRNQ